MNTKKLDNIRIYILFFITIIGFIGATYKFTSMHIKDVLAKDFIKKDEIQRIENNFNYKIVMINEKIEKNQQSIEYKIDKISDKLSDKIERLQEKQTERLLVLLQNLK